uniref:DAN domain-containing protein n=1 Tax=Macrostomum lignano TaxID=282301 RepID=A0A1I8FRT9_9PLAT
ATPAPTRSPLTDCRPGSRCADAAACDSVGAAPQLLSVSGAPSRLHCCAQAAWLGSHAAASSSLFRQPSLRSCSSVAAPAAGVNAGLTFPPQGKDSRWLTLEALPRVPAPHRRRVAASRTPPAHVEVQQNGRGKCQRRGAAMQVPAPAASTCENSCCRMAGRTLIIKELQRCRCCPRAFAVGQYIPISAGVSSV